MIKIIAISTLIFSVLLSILFYLIKDASFAFSLFLGGLVMFFNLLALNLLWKIIFSQKSIALALLIIIFKYSVLGLVLYLLTQSKWINSLAFVVGLSSLMLAILTSLAYKKVFKKEIN